MSAGGQVEKVIWNVSSDEIRDDMSLGCERRGEKFRVHPARSARGAALATRAFEFFIAHFLEIGNELGIRIGFGVRIVKAIDIGEQDEAFGFHHTRDQRRQSVVVSEFDLFGRDRVVFIQNRDGLPFE